MWVKMNRFRTLERNDLEEHFALNLQIPSCGHLASDDTCGCKVVKVAFWRATTMPGFSLGLYAFGLKAWVKWLRLPSGRSYWWKGFGWAKPKLTTLGLATP